MSNQYNGRDGNGYQPLPEPPPMRVGYNGDTVGRDGVRHKADGSLRTWYPEHVFPLVGFGIALALLVLGLALQ